jgi:hypothetical protein
MISDKITNIETRLRCAVHFFAQFDGFSESDAQFLAYIRFNEVK